MPDQGGPQFGTPEFWGEGWDPEAQAANTAGVLSSGAAGAYAPSALGYTPAGAAGRDWHTGGLYQFDESKFDPERGWGQSGQTEMDLARQMGGWSGNRGNIREARSAREAMRRSQLQGLQQLWARAQGQDSIVKRQAQLEREAAQRALASQIASTRGGASPAAQRAALYAQAGMGQQMAGDVATRAAQERLQALTGYMQGAQGIRGADIQSQLAEQALEAARQKFELGREQAALGWGGLGLQEKQFAEKMGMTLEELKQKQWEAALNRLSAEERARITGQFGMAQQEAAKEKDIWDKMGFVGQAIGGVGQGIGSLAKMLGL
jgi:hypothetical protein